MKNQSLNIAYKVTSAFMESIPKSKRKKYGQFFTSRKTAEFMASLFTLHLDKPQIKILDAGAGTGLLATALVERLRSEGYKGEILVTCYENDKVVLPVLEESMNNLMRLEGIKYEIKTDNYLLSQRFAENDLYLPDPDTYDMIIGNPPYLKIPKDAPEAITMPEVCYGAPNLYFLFLSMGIRNLKDNDELVYIIPRSWTSGAYFERFRAFLFRYCSITNIHIFGSRDKVFDGEVVLQETMIVKLRKTRNHPETIHMSSSETSDFSDIKHYDVPYDTVVAPNRYVFLVTSPEEAETLSRVNRQNNTLNSDNLRMRTGLIVDFRSRDVLRDEEENGTYPLFFSQHIKDGRVSWPIGKEGEYILTNRLAYLQENTDYIFVKRFTAKEDKRRLQCGIYLTAEHKPYKYISTQNKINYIKCDSPEIAFGLFAILNSTLYDNYYRILNGSTQVNSTEINIMPIPSRSTIQQMGIELIGQELTEQNCNKIIDKWIK